MKKIITLFFLIGSVSFHASAQKSSATNAVKTTDQVLHADQLWSQSTSQNLKLVNGKIQLDNHVLIEEDAAGLGSIRSSSWDTLSNGVIMRKKLNVPVKPTQDAVVTMLLYPIVPSDPLSGGKIAVKVNGHDPIIYELKHFWTSVKVPAGYLKSGENIVDVSTYGENTKFRLPLALRSNFKVGSIEAAGNQNKSERSTDNGKTWKALYTSGANKEAAEYPIRFKLQSFQDNGWLKTAVINLADKPQSGVLYNPVQINDVSVKTDVLNNSGLQVKYRSGNTHSPEAGGWSEWKSVTPAAFKVNPDHRFLQLQLNYAMTEGNSTPSLNGISVKSTWKPSGTQNSNLTVTESKNNPLVRSSYDFKHEDPLNSDLQEFRKNYQLDKVVEGSKTEIEKIRKLRGWAASRWDWYLPKAELKDLVSWDSRYILNIKNNRDEIGGNCLHYAIVLAQACQSFGIPARIVNTNYAIWGGHELVEVWSRDFGKWIMVDPNFDTSFYDRLTKVPLNILELHNLFLDTYYPGKEIVDRDTWSFEDRDRRSGRVDPEKLPINMEVGGHANSGQIKEDYVWWKVTLNKSNPGYSGGYGFFNTAEVRWVPRSNWLSQAAPLPVTHGRTHWGWDGYLAWTDAQTPETPEHRNFVRKDSDLYNELFTVDYSAQPVSDGSLKIDMATDSPGFKHYEVIENGKTITNEGSSFVWNLVPGVNKLELRSVDVLGNKGQASSLTVNYKKGN